MERHLREVLVLARNSPQTKTTPVDVRILVDVLNEVAPSLQSPFDDDRSVQIILCNEEKALLPPEGLDLNPRNYIGLGRKDKQLYLVLWDHAGKVRYKRKIQV